MFGHLSPRKIAPPPPPWLVRVRAWVSFVKKTKPRQNETKLLKSLAHEVVLRQEKYLYHVFILKCVSITNVNIEH